VTSGVAIWHGPGMPLTQVLMRMSLARQIFLVEVLVLGLAAILLLVSPLKVSAPAGIPADVSVIVGLGIVLLIIHLGLRRLIAPLKRLADAMGTVDPREPVPDLRGYVLPDDDEVTRLVEAFEQMLERFRVERLESDRRTVAAQDAERRRVASEIHDELGQTLTALALQIERADLPADAREPMQRTVARALSDVRGISRRLRPEVLDDLGLVNALIALTSRVSQESGLSVERAFAGPVPDLGPETELVVYRIAQEALTNAIRHAHATRATVALRHEGERVELTVGDNGTGFSAPPPPDGGIAGMHERSRLVDGELDVTSDPNRGTVVRFSVPTTTAVPTATAVPTPTSLERDPS
jgi:two-component system sensor histidine kinase UhpB